MVTMKLLGIASLPMNANGSLSMTPINDGYQQIQDPCAAVSNFIENYNDTEYYTAWAITVDPTFGPKLQLYQFDGSPLAPQFQISTTPNMLPTTQLRNLPSATATSGASRRSLEKKSNDAPSSHIAIALAATAGMMSLSVVAFLL
ncbi:hypothetical protein H0H92_003442 [Tricholoma furcatifolium]|nr:hypothetical protein H0H92_003442 [Tricholoma furcatifolium]